MNEQSSGDLSATNIAHYISCDLYSDISTICGSTSARYQDAVFNFGLIWIRRRPFIASCGEGVKLTDASVGVFYKAI